MTILAHPIAVSECVHCATSFTQTKPWQIYCSSHCRVTANNEEARLMRLRSHVFMCSVDDCHHALDYVRGSKLPTLCAEHIRKMRSRQVSHIRATNTKPCTIEGCAGRFRSRGLCGKHYRAWEVAEGKVPHRVWDDSRRDAQQRRRATKRETTAEPIDINAVIARDGIDCTICHEPVDMTLHYPHRMSRSIEHRISLSNGGSHTLANVGIAHWICNVRKGNRDT